MRTVEQRIEMLMEKRLASCCTPHDRGCEMSVPEMISSIGNDTELLLGAAKHALLQLGPLDQCAPGGSTAIRTSLTGSERQELEDLAMNDTRRESKTRILVKPACSLRCPRTKSVVDPFLRGKKLARP